MSETSATRASRRRDAGMTLPELLIAVTVSALIAGVLATSIIVTLRQQDNTEGRLNVARAEQMVSMWMPADLASAEAVDTSPEATPCGSPTCGGVYLGDGSNVLMLEWTEVGEGEATCPPEGMSNCTVTRVTYNFYPAADGQLYELRRVECTTHDLVNWSCDAQVILRELPGPPGGEAFVAGVAEGSANCAARLADNLQPDCTRPIWVIVVSEPLDPCAGLTGAEFTACVGTESGGTTKDANRVVVSINGGGDGAGSGGGVNQISITAGGTARQTITADSMTGAPSFLEAHSRCGGPLTLIIDQSGSIPSYAHPRVRAAAVEFVRLLRGTPVDIQVIEFDTTANSLGDGQSANPEPGWHEYFEMTEEADWTRLEQLLNGMAFGGGTNWEDALFHTFYNPDGTTPQIVPETVVFFTDGVPTYSRQSHRRSPGIAAQAPLYDGSLWQTWTGSSWQNGETGSAYNQGAFQRADNIAARVRAEQAGYVRLIGVGIGGISDYVRWLSNPGAGYKTIWERGYGRYQQGSPEYSSRVNFQQATRFRTSLDTEKATSFQTNLDFERTVFQTNLDFEKRTYWGLGPWTDTDAADYYANSSSSTYRIHTDSRPWVDVSDAIYNARRSSAPSNFRASWTDTTAADYYANSSDSDYRIATPARSSWSNLSETLYDAHHATSPANFSVVASSFADVSQSTYFANRHISPNKWRIGPASSTQRGWSNITSAEYDAHRSLDPSRFQADTWVAATPTEYYTGQPLAPQRWQINGTRDWYLVTEAEYNAYHGTDTTVNWRPGTTWTWVSKVAYDAGVLTNPSGFKDTGSKTYMSAAVAPDFEVVSSGSSTNPQQYRQRRIYPATGPYEGIEARQFSDKQGKEILARLIAADSVGTPYLENADEDGSDNSEIANMFVIPGNDDAAWAKLTPAMKAIALGECGGTLTLSTKTSAGTAVSAPFTYENSAVFRADGSAVTPFQPNVVTTNAQYRTRGFDYAVPGGTYITTEIRPQASSVLLRFQPLGWECRAGARVLTAAEINETPIDLTVTNPDGSTTTVPSGWSKINVRVGANEAVACVLRVAQTS